jgi:hypothetical protein
MASSDAKKRETSEADNFRARRIEMVQHSIAARGVRDVLVLDAIREVPRELFVPARLREFAYEDAPLPIPDEQTISQPYIVAFMAEALLLKGGDKVLEIGAGSGYAAAVLSEIAAHVFTVERVGRLAETAAERLADLGYDNVMCAMATARWAGLTCSLRRDHSGRRRPSGAGIPEMRAWSPMPSATRNPCLIRLPSCSEMFGMVR